MKFKKQHDALLTPGFFLFSLFSNIDGFLWDLNWALPVSLSVNYLYMFALLGSEPLCCQFMLLVLSRKIYVLTLQKTRRLPLIAELLMLCCKNCIKHISVYLNTVKHWTKKPPDLGRWSVCTLGRQLSHGLCGDVHFSFCGHALCCLWKKLESLFPASPVFTFLCNNGSLSHVEMPFGPREACRYLCEVKSEVAFIPSSKIYHKQIYFFFLMWEKFSFSLKVKRKP